MGVLANSRHERFAQELAKGSSQADAYAAAGFKPSRHHAARLVTNGNVQARVSELQSQAAEIAKIDAAWVLRKAAKLHEKAMAAGAFGPAKGALDLIGKHVEVQAFREQVQHSGVIEYRNLSDEEIEARIAALTTDAARPTAH